MSEEYRSLTMDSRYGLAKHVLKSRSGRLLAKIESYDHGTLIRVKVRGWIFSYENEVFIPLEKSTSPETKN